MKKLAIAITFATVVGAPSVEVTAQTNCRPGDTACQQAQEAVHERLLQQHQAQEAARQRQLQLQMQQQQAQEPPHERQQQQQAQEAARHQRQPQPQQQQPQEGAPQRGLQRQQHPVQEPVHPRQPWEPPQAHGTRVPQGSRPPQTPGSASNPFEPAKAGSQHLGQPRGLSAGEAHTVPRAKNISVGSGVTAVAQPRSRVLTVTRANPDGSKIVVNQRFARNKAQVVNAYAVRKDAARGTVTRTYLDGHKVVTGKGFTQYTAPGGYSITTHANGLREAYRGDGRPAYRERWRTRTAQDGAETRVISRTVYSETVINQTVVYGTPIVRTYVPEMYYGVQIFAYEPALLDEVFFGPFFIGFARPLIVTAACLICPAPVVAFAHPVQQYSDPVDLVGDLQITGAVSDGGGAPQAADQQPPPPPASDPEVAQLAQQVAALQQEVDSARADNAELRSQIDSLQAKPTSQPKPTAGSADTGVAYTIPEGARQQIHRQVRDNIELHKSNQPLTWPYLVKSGRAKDYVFQVSEMISAVDTSGEECSLSGGDLLKLDEGAAPDEPVLRMRVVAGKATSCGSGAVVNIGVSDAQGMLNDFNARQEAIMNKVRPKLAGGTNV